MGELDVDLLLLSVGADLPYLTGYEAMPLERLTMLVLPRAGDAQLVVPRLEAPRVEPQADVFEIVAWDETEDPVALVATLAGRPGRAAIGISAKMRREGCGCWGRAKIGNMKTFFALFPIPSNRRGH